MSVPISIALEFVLNGVVKLAEASERIRTARAEGRDHLNAQEWQGIVEANDQARRDAQAAVDQAIIEGR